MDRSLLPESKLVPFFVLDLKMLKIFVRKWPERSETRGDIELVVFIVPADGKQG